ncbi:MAG: Crp/FNR family transcriptional regulator, partial [Sediminibacterium sp.]|nr:Crp/FNR family transcriptional regulator [Sediminibacterium sp.]
MRTITRFACFICLAVATVSFVESKKPPRVLVFAKTKGFHHASIPVGIAAVQKLGADNGFEVDTTTDAGFFTKKQLKKYDAVIFLSTTGDVLNGEQQEAFQKFIHSGKGFVGVHAATDTEYDWPWYNQLVGAYFKSHPKQQEAVLNISDATNASTHHLPAKWKRFDEWYNFKSIQNGLHVLITIDEKSYTGGENGDVHP